MYRIALSILFLICILGQSLYLPMLSVWLELNRDYISENLCINRFEPELMCSGQCYIDDLTIEAAEADPEELPGVQSEQRIPISLISPTSYDLALFTPEQMLVPDPLYLHSYSFQYVEGVFRPPSV